MSIKVCHLSDWHGEQCEVPWADAYFVTGDMLDNYPKYDRHYCRINKIPWMDRRREIHKQAEVVRKLKFRRFLGNPNAPVYIVTGNHDFVHLSNAFGGGPVFEIGDASEVFMLGDLRIGGFRGVEALGGDWNDEMTDEELHREVAKLPKDLDILLTHAPPHGILDKVDRGPRVGIKALASWLSRQGYIGGKRLRLHCFGHIHEQFGSIAFGPEGKTPTIFSNAATGYITYEISDTNVELKECVRNACIVGRQR
jgi:Icc-related predicted phosphoesterase